MHQIIPPVVFFISCLVISGCDGTSDDHLQGPVSAIGASVLFEANLPEDSTSLNIAAAVYKDGLPEPMIGGDLIEITAESGKIYLSNDQYQENYYAGTLPLTNLSGEIHLEIVHDPQASRSDRWYPTDEVVVDPDTSSLVSYTSSLTLPDDIIITAPQPALVYTSLDDNVTLEWTGSAADSLSMVSHARCFSDTNNHTDWVHTFDITDDQSYAFSIGDLLPTEGTLQTAGSAQNVLTGFIQILGDALLSGLTLGLYQPEEVSIEKYQLNFCALNVSLVRKKNGTLGDGAVTGTAIGSRSDSINMEYRP